MAQISVSAAGDGSVLFSQFFEPGSAPLAAGFRALGGTYPSFRHGCARLGWVMFHSVALLCTLVAKNTVTKHRDTN